MGHIIEKFDVNSHPHGLRSCMVRGRVRKLETSEYTCMHRGCAQQPFTLAQHLKIIYSPAATANVISRPTAER